MGQAGHLRLRDITLSRIPHLRSFVNDALLDVLYFMSPAYHQVRPSVRWPLRAYAFHSFTPSLRLHPLHRHPTTHHPQVILDEVAAEMNRIVSLFRQHCRRFSGKVSIAAHSLGGVICFDLLANQESVRPLTACLRTPITLPCLVCLDSVDRLVYPGHRHLLPLSGGGVCRGQGPRELRPAPPAPQGP